MVLRRIQLEPHQKWLIIMFLWDLKLLIRTRVHNKHVMLKMLWGIGMSKFRLASLLSPCTVFS